MAATLLAWLSVPIGVVLEVWRQGRDTEGFYMVCLVFGLPFALLAGCVGLLLGALALGLGVASRGLAVCAGGELGVVAGVTLGSGFPGGACVLAGLAAGAVWWSALPEAFRRTPGTVAP